ncbi:MAG TPA: DNA-processing protein DprA [Paludibacteraceae bacterium]|nr:DNA-processing protein DprA [Paludibacteraceae bacterium]
MDNKLLYQIAITQIKGLGSINSKNLLAYVGDIEEIFHQKSHILQKIPGIGILLSKSILEQKDAALEKATKEIQFITKHGITPLFYTDKNYPERLKECPDAPILLYYKGNTNLNTQKTLAIVGTRNATEYGKTMCTQLIKELANNHPELCIISGLAYGIDICAHKEALHMHLPTVAVLGHGLDRIYPAQHATIAKKILTSGGLLTEFPSETNADKPNFVRRNRIIAGTTDATLIVESAARGGAIITTEIANSYNRDVFAVPGKCTDEWSVGCNNLIKQHKAALVNSASDIEYIMGWTKEQTSQKIEQQQSLFVDLSDTEQEIFTIIKQNKVVHIDVLAIKISKSIKDLSPILLSMEFKGVIKCLPGNIYSVV